MDDELKKLLREAKLAREASTIWKCIDSLIKEPSLQKCIEVIEAIIAEPEGTYGEELELLALTAFRCLYLPEAIRKFWEEYIRCCEVLRKRPPISTMMPNPRNAVEMAADWIAHDLTESNEEEALSRWMNALRGEKGCEIFEEKLKYWHLL